MKEAENEEKRKPLRVWLEKQEIGVAEKGKHFDDTAWVSIEITERKNFMVGTGWCKLFLSFVFVDSKLFSAFSESFDVWLMKF